jgi:phytoene dehydrogenase-like protein
VAELLDTMTTDPWARRALDALVRLATYADAFDEQAADVLTEQLRDSPVRYLDGGWGALVARLRHAFVAVGGQLLSGASVRHVHLDAVGGAEVELADGRMLSAPAVVLAAGGPAEAAALVDGPASARFAAWARGATPVRLASLDVALARRPEVPPIVLGADRPVYLSVHSDRARLAPAGGAVVHLARFLPLGGTPPAGTRTELEGVLDTLDPRWRSDVVHARYLPDLTLTHDGGAAATGGRRGRPGPAVPEAPQLFVAGDWVGTGGHLAQASLASAALAADLAASYVAGGGSARPFAPAARDAAGVAR